jgi:hypothetical protein
MESRAMGLVLGACLMLACLVPLTLWSIRTIIEHTLEKNSLPCNDATKIQTPESS